MELYRRHTQKCTNRDKGIAFTQCTCPVWVDGPHPLTGKRIRRSLDTRDWQRAKRQLDRWETEVKTNPEFIPVPTLKNAVEAYMLDCKDRKLAKHTLESYQHTLNTILLSISPATPISEVQQADIKAFMTEWKVKIASTTLTLRITHLKWFFNFCIANKWIAAAPTDGVKTVTVKLNPTMPYTVDEVGKIIDAINRFQNASTRKRVKALVYILLYSGLRISDVVSLTRNQLGFDGRLLIRMEKTKHPLYVKLPPECVATLLSLPNTDDRFLWQGSYLRSSTAIARQLLCTLGRYASIHVHPHRFRDTFAVELLKSGADIRTVQKLLGHTSIKTTEQHYAPWVVDFQRQLDEATARLKFG